MLGSSPPRSEGQPNAATPIAAKSPIFANKVEPAVTIRNRRLLRNGYTMLAPYSAIHRILLGVGFADARAGVYPTLLEAQHPARPGESNSLDSAGLALQIV